MSGVASPLLRKPALAAIALLIALLMLPNLIWLVHSHGLITWIAALVLPATLLVVLFALLGRWHETARAEQPVRVTAAGARQEGASGGGFGAEADPDGDLSGTTSAGGGPPASGGFRIRD